MRWLLDVMADFRTQHATPEVEVSSIWMDIDNVDFTKEAFRLRHPAWQRTFRCGNALFATV
jgi:hypothetical protein